MALEDIFTRRVDEETAQEPQELEDPLAGFLTSLDNGDFAIPQTDQPDPVYELTVAVELHDEQGNEIDGVDLSFRASSPNEEGPLAELDDLVESIQGYLNSLRRSVRDAQRDNSAIQDGQDGFVDSIEQELEALGFQVHRVDLP